MKGSTINNGAVENGVIKLTHKDGNSETLIASIDGLEDYALDSQTVTVDENGDAVLKVKDRYDATKSYDVKLDGLVTESNMAAANNLEVDGEVTTEHKNGGNWTITDSQGEEPLTLTNTTLDETASNSYNNGGSNLIKGDSNTSYKDTVYGRNYKVIDTDGNEVELNDVASAEKLGSVDSKVGDTNYSSTNYIHNGDSLTEATSDLDTAIKTTANKVDAGWTATDGTNDIKVNPKDGTTTLKFAGDDKNNILVTADTDKKAINVELNSVVTLKGDAEDNYVVLNGDNGTINAKNSNEKTILGFGSKTTNTFDFNNGGKFETTKSDIKLGMPVNPVTHTAEFNEDGATFTKTEGKWWNNSSSSTNIDGGTITISSDDRKGKDIVINGATGEMTGLSNTTVDYQGFATEGKAATEEQLKKVQENLTAADKYITGGTIDTTSGTLNLTGTNGLTANVSGLTDYQVTADGSSFDKTTNKLTLNLKDTLNTSNSDKQVTFDGIASTDDVEKAQNAATTIVKPGANIEVSEPTTASEDGHKEYTVSLKDNITLGEDPNNQININGKPEGNSPAFSVGTDKFVVDQDGSLSVSDKFNVDAETGNIYAANNKGSAIVMNDDSVAFSADGNGVAVSDEGILLNTNGLDKDIRLVTKGTIVSVDKDGATFTNTNTNETTNINGGTINVGDKFVVDQDGTTTIAVNDGSVMGNNTTMTVNKDGVSFSAYGNGTTVIDGQTIYAGGVVINNNGSGTINGLTNTTWDDELAKQVANSEELQGTAATQGQLQQAVSEVATEAAKQHTTITAGDDNLIVESTVNANGRTDYEVSLSDEITLGDVTNKTESLTLSSDGTYIPASANAEDMSFINDHGGGFIIYSNKADGSGLFAVTADGMVHAQDVMSYMNNPNYDPNDPSTGDKVLRYSLNDIGDIVTQIAHGKFDGTDMEYTLISDFTSEKDKDTPFQSTDNPERTIGLAVREDGAVVVGAVVDKSGNLDDSGIRINAEKRVNKDGTTSSDNMATITGLENTEWKPPTPVATLAANDGSTTVTSRAATEAQLDDLYNTVAAYNTYMDANGSVSINYNAMTLRGDAYNTTTHSGGTIINNVGYAKENPDGTIDGSQAVNVDYLNDAINNAVKDGGAISDSDRHLQEGTYHVNDQGKVELIVADEKGENQSTVTIDNIANKNDITNLDNKIDNTFNKLDDKINNIDNVETDVKGGNINEDGTISLKTENEDGTTTNVTLKGQLTDSGVVQEGTTFDKETGTLTITSQDKYSGETSSVKVDGIASTEVVGATTKEDLATAYKDADKDGNATTEYITDSESMVEADVALDHAIQDVANTSYANDMVLSNRIDSVEKRLGNVEERIDKVGAMAAAIANLRTMGFDPEAPTEIAIGVGQYKSETGIAIGVFHYPNQDFMLSASLSSSGDELMGGIGATWKLGRKSAAERAKDEEARHLEQAEEMKKLAQQEKVKAQAQRHAKLLAERQQASQKNA